MASPALSFRPPDTPMVRTLIAVLLGVYAVDVVASTVAPALVATAFEWVALIHDAFWRHGRVWTAVTYGVLHDVGRAPLLDVAVCAAFIFGLIAFYRSPLGRREPGLAQIGMIVGSMILGQLGLGAPFHVLGNAMVLWFFGPEFERRWGGARFLRFCVACVAGGALLSSALWWVMPGVAGSSVIGASGATVGLIAAFSIYFPEAQVFYGLAVPIRGKHLVIIAFLFDFVNLIGPGTTAILVHAGGALTAFLMTTGYWRPSKWRRGGSPQKPIPHLRLVKPGRNDWIQRIGSPEVAPGLRNP